MQRCPSQRQKETLVDAPSVVRSSQWSSYQPHRSFACLRCPPYCFHCREMVHAGSETQSKVPLGRLCIRGRGAAFERLLIRIYGLLISPDPMIRVTRLITSPTVETALWNCSRAGKKVLSCFRSNTGVVSVTCRNIISICRCMDRKPRH